MNHSLRGISIGRHNLLLSSRKGKSMHLATLGGTLSSSSGNSDIKTDHLHSMKYALAMGFGQAYVEP